MKGHNKDNRDDVDQNRDRKDQDGGRHHSKLENKLTRYFDEFLNDVGLARTNSGIKLRGHADGAPDGKQPSWSPAVDIRELDKEYVIIADVPGVGREDIDIEYNDSLLIISGQNKQDPYTANTQEINIGRDGHHQYQQQDVDPRQQQQPTDPRQQQQPTDQRYQQQPTDQRYQQQPTDQRYQQQPTNQQYQQQPTDQQYQQQPTDQRYQQQPTDQRYQQQPTNQQYQQQPTDQQYQQQPTDQQYQQQPTDQRQQPTNQQYQQQPTDQRHPPEEQPQTDQFQHPSKHRQRTTNAKGEKIHIQERPYGYFYRTVQLPNNVRADGDFHANLNNGVLKIRIPKSTGNEKPRRKITIT